MPYQPQVTQGYHTNYAQGFSQLGSGIARGIEEGKRKREKKKQGDSVLNIFRGPLFGMSDDESKDALNSFDDPQQALEWVQFTQQQEQHQKFLERKFTYERNQNQLEDTRAKNAAILEGFQTEFENELAVRDQNLKEKKESREAAEAKKTPDWDPENPIIKEYPELGYVSMQTGPNTAVVKDMKGNELGEVEIGDILQVDEGPYAQRYIASRGGALTPIENTRQGRWLQAVDVWSKPYFQGWYNVIYDKSGKKKGLGAINKGLKAIGFDMRSPDNEMFTALEEELSNEFRMLKEGREPTFENKPAKLIKRNKGSTSANKGYKIIEN